MTWLLAGWWLVSCLDRITLLLVDRRGIDRLVFDGGTLELDGKRLDLMNPAFARQAELSMDTAGRVVLSSGGRQFPLGPGRPSLPVGRAPRFEFTQDPGDEVILTIERSRVAWPTAFEMNFMTGYAPSRKRSVYVRLRWTKPSGARLELLWKTEQAYYRRDGWLPPREEAITDGLIHVDMRPAG
jgi:hypothetical protein